MDITDWGIYGDTEQDKHEKKVKKGQQSNLQYGNPVYNLSMEIENFNFKKQGQPLTDDGGGEITSDYPAYKNSKFKNVEPSISVKQQSKFNYPSLSNQSSNQCGFEEKCNVEENNEAYELETNEESVYESIDQSDLNQAVFSAPPSPPPVESLKEIKEKRYKKKQCVIKELLSTEQDFLRDTEITIKYIMQPLISEELPMDIQVDVLFGNLEDICKFSKNFLCCLKQSSDHMETKKNKTEDKPLNIGKIFIDHIPQMKELYTIYCRNHDDAITMLEKVEDDSNFQGILEDCLCNVKSKINVFDLGSFLIKPVQRILKYPLLLQELLKQTDVSDFGSDSTCHSDLVQSLKMMQDVANSINEEKRRKDLVRKYRKGSQGTLSGKISKLSLHSVMKKSARISLRLGHVTGLGTAETNDENFKYFEKRFKDIERVVKDFRDNCETFVLRCKEWLHSEFVVYENLSDLFASFNVKALRHIISASKKINEDHYRKFYDELQLKVLSPLSSLLNRFEGPHSIIGKRFDKLLDLENSQKNVDSKEKVQMAKNIYEALNVQLLEELPKLSDLSMSLLDRCAAIFMQLYAKFQQNILTDTFAITTFFTKGLDSANIKTLESLEEEYFSSFLQRSSKISGYSIVPPTFEAVATPNVYHSLLSMAFGNATAVITDQDQQIATRNNYLLANYFPHDLFVTKHVVKAENSCDLSCFSNQMLGVVKRQDPMGKSDKWLMDNGDTKGFVATNVIASYDLEPNKVQLQPTEIQIGAQQLSPKASDVDNCQSQSLFKNYSPPSQCPMVISHDGCQPGDITDEEEEMLDDDEYIEWKDNYNSQVNYRVEFDFEARSSLELSVKRGEILELLVPNDLEGNADWWLMANTSGKQGYVPFNYMVKAEYL